jgi:hypothetical protein
MNKTTFVVAGLGLIAVGHYVVSPCLRNASDAPDAPPLASIISIAPSTGTVTFNYTPITVDAITDAEYAAPVVDTRHPLTVMSSSPPTLASLLKSS